MLNTLGLNPLAAGSQKNHLGEFTSVSNAIVGPPSTFDLAGTTTHLLSLGNGGSITCTFDWPIGDGPGADFAVFENGFSDFTDWEGTSRADSTRSFAYLEFAFVDVATTPSAWARFPSAYLASNPVYNLSHISEDRFASQDATWVDGLAGKHTLAYGTPFDLARLTNAPAVLTGDVDLHEINYIRLTDVVGDGREVDFEGRPILDPYYDFQLGYPEPAFPAATDGFELRAIAVLHPSASIHIKRGQGSFEITWFARSNRWYQLQWTDRPVDGTWSNLGPVAQGYGAAATVRDAQATLPCKLYRVVDPLGP